jgi:hypothetical protein
MSLSKPALAEVSPGQPVTAQGWNAIIDAIDTLYDFALALGTGMVEVSVLDGNTPVSGATVVATPAQGGLPVAAVPPHGGNRHYILGGLVPGAWVLEVAAAGYKAGSINFDVPLDTPLTVALERSGALMPDLFGMTAISALGELKNRHIATERVIDVTGRELPPAKLPPDAQNALILAQQPANGSVLAPGDRARLVVSLTVTQEPVVTMPNLTGLTLDETREVLDRSGLVLGKVTTIKT